MAPPDDPRRQLPAIDRVITDELDAARPRGRHGGPLERAAHVGRPLESAAMALSAVHRVPSRVVKLEGDEEGITALKALHAKDKGALKFLITDAKTNTDLRTTFKAEDGRVFVLRVDPKTGNLIIEPPL